MTHPGVMIQAAIPRPGSRAPGAAGGATCRHAGRAGASAPHAAPHALLLLPLPRRCRLALRAQPLLALRLQLGVAPLLLARAAHRVIVVGLGGVVLLPAGAWRPSKRGRGEQGYLPAGAWNPSRRGRGEQRRKPLARR